MAYHDILVVDDSETSRMIIKRCLEIAGFADSVYHEAADGLGALSLLKEQQVDLIVTDLKMPKMDGGTLIQKLRNDPRTREVPILVVSSMGNDAREQELRKAGASWIVHKPLSPEALAEVLQ
jgi:two-component system chemotaxis response regulator CheY